MSLIQVSNLTFAYDGSVDNVFENASFQINTDWKLGFIGRNGRGKTTFLHLLQGKYTYSGQISAQVDFSYFPYEVADKQAKTMEVIRLIGHGCQDWEIVRELSLLKISEQVLERPFATLSNGEQTKILLAALFLKENNFLLIDEPTNHLDREGRALVGEYLKSKTGFILVSHDRAFLDNCVDHVLSINKADIDVQRGNFSSWLANKENQDNFELARNEKLQKDIAGLQRASRQSGKWADAAEKTKKGKGSKETEKFIGTRSYYGEKSRKMQKRRKNLETRQQAALDEKSKLLKNVEKVDSVKITPLAYHADRFASFKDVSIFYGEKTVCENVTFSIEKGDRIALCGKNGSGKSSIVRLLCGDSMQYSGDFQRGSQLIVSHVPQDTAFLSGDISGYALKENIDESLFKAILRKLDFSREQFNKDMRDFSGGQKKKVLIAKSLCERAHLYIWDEPLNFIDVLSRMQIEDLLLTYQPTIFFVEHDIAFCDKIATKKVVLP